MKNLNRPGSLLATIGTALILLGLGSMPFTELGAYLMYAGFLIAGIFWLWSISDVLMADDLRLNQKMCWLIVTVSVPVIGGLLFHIIHPKGNRIVT